MNNKRKMKKKKIKKNNNNKRRRKEGQGEESMHTVPMFRSLLLPVEAYKAPFCCEKILT
jgi:hypothetical protein